MAKQVTAEDVEATRNEVEQLQAKVAKAEQDRLAALHSQNHAVEHAQLLAEKARLELELQRTEAGTAHQKDSLAVAAPIAAAQESMAAAVEAQKAEAALAKADEKAAAKANDEKKEQ